MGSPTKMIIFIVSMRVVAGLATGAAFEQELLELPDCDGGGLFETLWSFFTDCSWDTIELMFAIGGLGVIPGAPDVVNFFFAFIPNVVIIIWFVGWVRGEIA